MFWLSRINEHSHYASGLLGPMLVTAAGMGLIFVPLSLVSLTKVPHISHTPPPAPGATAAQYTTTYAYYPDRAVQTVTDGLGNQTAYTYDNVGNVFQVTDPNKNITTYAYDLDHQRQQATDPSGNFTQTTRDADGRVTQSRDKLASLRLHL